MSRILVVDDDPGILLLIEGALSKSGHQLLMAANAEEGLEIIERSPVDLLLTDYVLPGIDGLQFLERLHKSRPDLKCILMTAFGTPDTVLGALRRHVADFLVKPFEIHQLLSTIAGALEENSFADVEVISAKPEWVELRVPCVLSAVPKLERILAQLKMDLPSQARDDVFSAFREMLNNAIEYGGKFDATKFVHVRYVRLKRAILYSIRDPGEGFDTNSLEHSAINNPSEDVLRHLAVRDEKGMRPGGFGILLTTKLVDELIYNEKRNELIFIKYLS